MQRLLLLTLPWIAGMALIAAVQPDSDSLAGLRPFPDRLKGEIHEIRDRASVVRELPTYQPIEEGFITEADLSALMKETIEDLGGEFQATLQSRSEAMRLMHLIGPDDDLATLTSETQGTSGLAGFYFPVKKSLLVVGEVKSVGALQEYILAHEYMHSFQDQAFHLENVLVPGRTPFTERAIIGQCIAEGDATVGAQEYMKKEYGENWERRLLAEALLAQRQATPQAGERSQVTTRASGSFGLARYVLFVYQDCAKFVTAIRDRDGWEGVNAIYDRLPGSSEQVLHPEKYRSGEQPKQVAEIDLADALGAEWKRESSEQFGEIDLLAYLTGLSVPDVQARATAEGWGGGTLSIYGNGQDTLVHLTLLWDLAADFNEFKTEYARALNRVSGTSGTLSPLQPTWSWRTRSSEFGYARWDQSGLRSDIVLSKDESSLGSARSVLESTGVALPQSQCYDVRSPADQIEVLEARWPPAAGQPLVAQVRYNLESHDTASLILFQTSSPARLNGRDGTSSIARGSGEITLTALSQAPSGFSSFMLQMLPPESNAGSACVIPIVSMQFDAAAVHR